MIKKIIFIAFLFFSISSFGQDIDDLRKKVSVSSDSELIAFVQKAKDRGLSLIDAEKQLILIGGKADEVKKLRDLWNKKNPKSSEIVQIPEKKAIKWKMSKTLLKRLNKNFTENKISDNH